MLVMESLRNMSEYATYALEKQPTVKHHTIRRRSLSVHSMIGEKITTIAQQTTNAATGSHDNT